MFKQKEINENPIETKRRELTNTVLCAYRELIITTEETYAGEQMIAMLPYGWLREDAEYEQNNARLDLYNIIVKYDEERLNLRNYCINHGLAQGNWDSGLVVVRKHLQEILFHKK